jgi:cytochrome c-type biogenesis protein CcmF
VIVGSLALFFWRLPTLRADNQLDGLLSREASFLVNNLLFLGITFAVFWGTIYPLVAEAITNQKISVGPPYFQQVAGPLFGALMLLMGIGPLMPWRRASTDNLRRSFLVPGSGAVLGIVLLAILGIRDPFAIVGFALCLFVLGTVLQEFTRGVLARHAATADGYLTAFVNLVRRNNRRYGGYIVHLGVVLIGAGVIGSQVYQQETQATLAPGQSVTLGGYTITANGIRTITQPGMQITEGVLTANGEPIQAQKHFFDNFPQQPSSRVGLRPTITEDLYVVLAGWEGEGAAARVSIAVFINPLVSWIWAGGVLLLLGTVVTLWPAPRPVLRTALAPSPRGAVGVTP